MLPSLGRMVEIQKWGELMRLLWLLHAVPSRADEVRRDLGYESMACPCTGNKSEAKALMSEAGVPVVPGYHGQDQSMSRSAPCTHHV